MEPYFWISVFLTLQQVFAESPIVSTAFGQIEGFKHEVDDGTSVDVFLGIRYAQAPDSFQRFKKPEMVEKWDPILHHAKHFRAACIPWHSAMLERENYSEDCLFLNIVTPSKRETGAQLPVMVYIHGGAFQFGDAESYGYKQAAANFVSKGIVFVSIQYRLGPFGFFTTGDNIAPGNMGLWDQTMALRFLQEVLSSFGGDPKQITLIGHSAGSSSVSHLLYSPHSNQLFNQAIQLSGSAFAESSISSSVIEDSRKLAEAIGCKSESSQKVLDCMMERTAEEILDGVDKIGKTRRHTSLVKFHPYIDMDFLPNEIEKLARKAPKKATIQGTTDLESGMFALKNVVINDLLVVPQEKWSNFTREDFLEFVTSAVAPEHEYGRKMAPFVEQLEAFYVSDAARAQDDLYFYFRKFIELCSDIQVNIPVFHEVDIKRLNGWPTFYYVIDHVVEANKHLPIKGAFHAMELPFLFDVGSDEHRELTEKDQQFKENIVDLFSKFIKTGSPNDGSKLKWDTVTAEHPARHLRINDKLSIEGNFRPEAVDFWLNKVPKAVGVDMLKKSRLPGAKAHRVHTEL